MKEYKGYNGIYEYDEDAQIYHGRVTGIKGVVTFEADTLEELEQAFQDSVDDYLEFCAELGREPETPYKRVIADAHENETSENIAENF